MTLIDDAARLADEGWTFLQSGKAHEAEQRFRQALAKHKESPAALHGLALIGHQTGNFVPALELFDRALAVDPQNPSLHANRGNSLAAMQRFDEAIASFQRALTLSPGLQSAMVNMATALHATGRLDEAVETMERVCETPPPSADAFNNLGNLYKDQGRLRESLDCYQRALEINPMMQQAFSNRLAALKVDSNITPEGMLREHQEWWCWFGGVATSAPLLRNPGEPDRLLRIGYVSPDCHTAVPAFLDPLIAAHDRSKFQVFCYFNNPQDPGKLKVLGVHETSRVLRGGNDQQVAQLIHADNIDILIDIAGHTGHNRLGVFARQPAPVQITWLDYLCTTGLANMDYRITDAIADPPGSEAFHSEKLLRLPHAQWCWQPDAQAPPVSAAPVDTNDYVTFGSFNNAQKLTNATLALWKELLLRIPDARLRVAGIPEGLARKRVADELGECTSRVEFLPRMSVPDYRRAFDAVDIALDPLPFSGATTTLDALWQGVPVLTLPGSASCSRSTASILTTLGLTGWIATGTDDFLSRAVRLAADRSALAELRHTLRDLLRRSPITDTVSFVGHLEALYRTAWRTWCEARKAAAGRADAGAGGNDALAKAISLIDSRQIDQAIAILKPLLHVRPHWEIAKREMARACLAWGQAHPEVRAAWQSPFEKVPTPLRVTAIVCSIRPDYFAAIGKRLSEQFARHEFELIGIHDAKSLCEAYNRGAAQANGDYLVFCHDDIDIPHADFGERLLTHLQTRDVVGVVGATHLVNSEWGTAGPPHVHGQIVHKPPGFDGYLYLAVALGAPIVDGIHSMDGVFIAMHRKVWEQVRFDDVTFDGFHVYDVDFTYRAHLAGFRLAVPVDLLLIHFSTGSYDLKWQTYNMRFLKKFPEMSNLPNPLRFANLHVKLQTLEQVERLHAGLFQHNFGA